MLQYLHGNIIKQTCNAYVLFDDGGLGISIIGGTVVTSWKKKPIIYRNNMGYLILIRGFNITSSCSVKMNVISKKLFTNSVWKKK